MSKVRKSVRVILLNPKGEFLLFLSHFEPGSGLDPAWVFPGGGIELGETPRAAAVRELFEETAHELTEEMLSAPVALIEHPMPDPRIFDSGEATFFVIQLESHIEVKSDNWTADEHRDTVSHKWWSLTEVLEQKPWIEPLGAIGVLETVLGPQG